MLTDPSADPDAERDDLPLAERVASWLQPRPDELLGLAVLVVGAVVATFLWWQQSATGPGGIAEAAAAGVAVGEYGEAAGPAPGVTGTGLPEPGETAPPGTPAGGTVPGLPDPASGRPGDPRPEGGGAPGGTVTVYVTGAVRTPGLVTLPAGARVGDAVAAAGGPRADADAARANLARPVSDGEQVHLPAIGEEAPPPLPGPDTGLDPSAAGSAADGPIDLNTADAAALETLPGIGPARAAAIIEHRTRHGPFQVPGDLRDVAGIGEQTFQRLAPFVVVR